MSDKTEGQRIVESMTRWFKTDEGDCCLDGTASGEYLRNRLMRAYQQGWADGRIDAKSNGPNGPEQAA